MHWPDRQVYAILYLEVVQHVDISASHWLPPIWLGLYTGGEWAPSRLA
jgi:hypothetical protein